MVTDKRHPQDERAPLHDHGARAHGCPDSQGDEAVAEERLDALMRQALQLALEDFEPTPAVWTRIRESLEGRSEGPCSGEQE
jgi:hypothetical protein